MPRWFDWLLGRGRPSGARRSEERAVKKDPARVVRELPLYHQVQRIGGNLSPLQVSEILRQADTGYMYRFVDLLNESRQRDCHLQSVLQTRELALQALKWQVKPYQAPNSKRAKLRDTKAAQFVDETLRRCDSLPKLFSHLNGAQYFGYAVAETVKEKRNGKIVPVDFDLISPRRFIFDTESGRLRWCDITAGMAYPGIDVRQAYPGKFIQFQPRVNGDVPCREGLGRVLVWAALFRNWDERDWLALAELAWKPWRMGQYSKDAGAEDIAALESILDAMVTNGVCTYPDTATIKIEWPKNSVNGNSAHKVLFDTLGSEMSKAVLGQTLTTEQGSRGTQALGTVHDEVRKDILEADARAVAATLKRDLIAPMVRENFGDGVMVPDFEFLTEEAKDSAAFSLAILNLARAGLRMSAKWVRDEMGMPEPEDGEELISLPSVEPSDDASGDQAPAADDPAASDA